MEFYFIKHISRFCINQKTMVLFLDIAYLKQYNSLNRSQLKGNKHTKSSL